MWCGARDSAPTSHGSTCPCSERRSRSTTAGSSPRSRACTSLGCTFSMRCRRAFFLASGETRSTSSSTSPPGLAESLVRASSVFPVYAQGVLSADSEGALPSVITCHAPRHARPPSSLSPRTQMERKGRIERVTDRLFEGEEAVLHIDGLRRWSAHPAPLCL